MTDTTTRIDLPQAATALREGCVAKGRFDLRQRTPSEIADQLVRDAMSLELTGASFSKDEAFYRTVAANAREAAEILAALQNAVDAARHEVRVRERTARVAAFLKAENIAGTIAGLMPASFQGPASIWCAAAAAIGAAIATVRDSEPRQSQVQELRK